MSVSTVDIATIRRTVGRALGFSRDSAEWSTNEATDVADVIRSGYALFLRPPRVRGESFSHQWSFLRPLGTIQLASGVIDYDMPTDFSGLDGNLSMVNQDLSTQEIIYVNESRIRQLRASTWSDNSIYYPQYCAIVPKVHDGQFLDTYQLQIWPTPDAAYTVQFRYFARQSDLGDDNPIPLGSGDHGETLLAAMLAAAESYLDDEVGPKRELFMQHLEASVDFDRKATSPENLGYNADHRQAVDDAGYIRSSRLTVYNKYPS